MFTSLAAILSSQSSILIDAIADFTSSIKNRLYVAFKSLVNSIFLASFAFSHSATSARAFLDTST